MQTLTGVGQMQSKLSIIVVTAVGIDGSLIQHYATEALLSGSIKACLLDLVSLLNESRFIFIPVLSCTSSHWFQFWIDVSQTCTKLDVNEDLLQDVKLRRFVIHMKFILRVRLIFQKLNLKRKKILLFNNAISST